MYKWYFFYVCGLHCLCSSKWNFEELTVLIPEPLCCLPVSSEFCHSEKGQSFKSIMEQCKSISQDHLHCLLLLSTSRSDRGGGDGGCRQTDSLSRWLTHKSLPINLWLSLQLFLTCTHWPNHRATPKPIWLGNSHRWQFICGTLPEQHTTEMLTHKHSPTHLCTIHAAQIMHIQI